MKIQELPLDKLIPYARNPRANREQAIIKVVASLKEFGWRQPIVVDPEMVIIAGHTRYEAAKRLGWTIAPVHVAEGLTPAQMKAYRIADNRTGQEAEWDYELLRLELEDLKAVELDLDLTGFSSPEIDRLFGEEVDYTGEWEGMPSFLQEDETAFRTLIVHFLDRNAVDDFVQRIGQLITDQTKYIYHPKQVKVETVHLRYSSDEGQSK
jgi:ParB-like chromosome segregation protein Spo0J